MSEGNRTGLESRTSRGWAALALVGLLGGGLEAGEIVDRVVAVVDRQAITLSEAQDAQRLRLLRGGQVPELAEVVERLIESVLIEREVERNPAEPVGAADLDLAIESLKESLGGQEALDAALRSRGVGGDELRVMLRRQIRINRYLERRFRPLVYVTEEDVERFHKEELLPELQDLGQAAPPLETVAGDVRRILEERELNRRIDDWIRSLKDDARIRRYVW